MVTREELVKEARTWIGTRFHHQGRLKKTENHNGGCDCIGLLVGISRDLGFTYKGKNIALYDNTDYGLLPDGKSLKNALTTYAISITETEIKPGDIGLFRFDENPQHVALFSDYHLGGLGLIHCYAQVKKVVEHAFEEDWKSKFVGAYRFYDVI